MIDKTDEQIARDKAAVDAMHNARSHMGKALDRIRTLEVALEAARNAMITHKDYVPAPCLFLRQQGNSAQQDGYRHRQRNKGARVMADYHQSEVYRRSERKRPDGKPVFPLAFWDRPVERKEKAA